MHRKVAKVDVGRFNLDSRRSLLASVPKILYFRNRRRLLRVCKSTNLVRNRSDLVNQKVSIARVNLFELMAADMNSPIGDGCEVYHYFNRSCQSPHSTISNDCTRV